MTNDVTDRHRRRSWRLSSLDDYNYNYKNKYKYKNEYKHITSENDEKLEVDEPSSLIIVTIVFATRPIFAPSQSVPVNMSLKLSSRSLFCMLTNKQTNTHTHAHSCSDPVRYPEPRIVSGTVMRPESFSDNGTLWIVYLLTYLLTYFLKNRPVLFPSRSCKMRPNLAFFYFCVHFML